MRAAGSPAGRSGAAGCDEGAPAKIRERLVHALLSAQQAVCADTEGDKETALALYTESSAVLEQILPFVPVEHGRVMGAQSSIYADRAAELRAERVEMAADAAAAVVPHFAVHFVEQPAPPRPPSDAVPGAIRRPFWLMRQISQSMQDGAYFTEAVYVPKAVWYQHGAQQAVRAVGAKIRYCERLCDLLSQLLEAPIGDTTALVQALDEFLEQAEALLRQLHKEMPKAEQQEREAVVAVTPQQPATRFGTAWNALRSRIADGKKASEPSATYNSYIPWLVNVFENVQRIDKWILHFALPEHGSDAVTQRLHKLSSHFYFGPCAFVLRDMFLLLQRFMKKSRESYSRLFPDSFQVGRA
eukprot:TRINITY_DN1117_c0_g4_i1.p1 TRINITY_DN1117_c0_g4~~TRINITY_DN1117_c0_g4_i1.p1  ORF type:complete len:381 (+),score=129.45 TRINITY_DN1117_c0_g4_i1:74-1144(+)